MERKMRRREARRTRTKVREAKWCMHMGITWGSSKPLFAYPKDMANLPADHANPLI